MGPERIAREEVCGGDACSHRRRRPPGVHNEPGRPLSFPGVWGDPARGGADADRQQAAVGRKLPGPPRCSNLASDCEVDDVFAECESSGWAVKLMTAWGELWQPTRLVGRLWCSTAAPGILLPFTQAKRLRRPDGAHLKTTSPSAAGLDTALLYVLEALSSFVNTHLVFRRRGLVGSPVTWDRQPWHMSEFGIWLYDRYVV